MLEKNVRGFELLQYSIQQQTRRLHIVSSTRQCRKKRLAGHCHTLRNKSVVGISIWTQECGYDIPGTANRLSAFAGYSTPCFQSIIVARLGKTRARSSPQHTPPTARSQSPDRAYPEKHAVGGGAQGLTTEKLKDCIWLKP